MRVRIRFSASAVTLVALSLACARDSTPVAPVTPSAVALGAIPASAEFSEWSDPEPIAQVSSSFPDITPFISSDGLSLYFGSTRASSTAQGATDLWVSRRASVDDAWGAPENLGPAINTRFIEVGPSVSEDGLLLFFSSSRPSGGPEDANCGEPGKELTHCDNDLWVSRRACTDHTRCPWETPMNLGPAVNTPLFEGGQGIWRSEFYFNRGSTANLVPSAPHPGPPGDIYVSRVNLERIAAGETRGGMLTEAVLVPELSATEPDGDDAVEQRVSVRVDGREMFFTSTGDGTPDIWVSTRQGVGLPWSTPQRLPEPLNTGDQELHPSISTDGTTLFFASNRGGNTDIYVARRTRIR